MIKVESIRIEEFRGIRDLTIRFAGKNYAVCGPNGTGKSGIVDALEFGLTGNISRLSGKGRGALSVKEHAPHVNSRKKPEKAAVTLEVSIPSTGKKATITRNVKAPRSPLIVPEEPEIRAAFEHAEQHPEFTLSRREIIKYVLAEPGERAKELQALLQLDKLETTRALLLKISNAGTRELRPLDSARLSAAENLMRALGITDLNQTTLLSAVNAQRAVLELLPLSKIEATTSIRDGLESLESATPVKVPKAQATRDIIAATNGLNEFNSVQSKEARMTATQSVKRLKENESRLTDVTRDAMLKTALDLFDDLHCPVCQTPWNPDEFRKVVLSQRKLLEDAARERGEVEKALAPVIAAIESIAELILPLVSVARNLPIPIDTQPLTALSQEIIRRVRIARTFLPLNDTIAVLEQDIKEATAAIEILPNSQLRSKHYQRHPSAMLPAIT